jgi:hypothetical protein
VEEEEHQEMAMLTSSSERYHKLQKEDDFSLRECLEA